MYFNVIIGESANGRIFGGFTTKRWNNIDEKGINDNYSFLFQINDLKNYYAIKGKGGIYCSQFYGPIFVGNGSSIEFCFGNNNRDCTGIRTNGYDYGNNKYVLEGNDSYDLKDYEVFALKFD